MCLTALALISTLLSQLSVSLDSGARVGMGFLTFLPFALLIFFIIRNRRSSLAGVVQKVRLVTVAKQPKATSGGTQPTGATDDPQSPGVQLVAVAEPCGFSAQLEGGRDPVFVVAEQ